MVNLRRAVLPAVALIAVALLGACGEDEPSGGKDPVASEAAAGAADDGGDDGGDGASKDAPDVCSIVPAAGVKRLLGTAKPRDASVSGESRCEYSGGGGGNLVVAYGPADGFDYWVSAFQAKPVGGVGDKAAEWGDTIYGLMAVKGDHALQFALTGSTPADKAVVHKVMNESLESL